MVKKAAKLIVSGTVQGAFFKNFCKENAEKLNLKGYVRNMETGEVEILVEGDNSDIEKIIPIIRAGPPHSQIRNVSIENRKWSGEFKGFNIMKF